MKKIVKRNGFPIIDAVTVASAFVATGLIAYKHISNAVKSVHKTHKDELKHEAAIKDISEKEIRVVAEEPVYINEYIAATAGSRNIDEVKNEEKTVFVTAKGSKYHENSNCIYLRNCGELIEKPIEEAKKDGLQPCVKCCGK